MCPMHRSFIAALALVLLVSCAGPVATQPAAPPTPSPPSVTATSAPTPSIAASQEPAPLPLAELGPYATGWRRMIEYVDPARQGREVTVTIWYPADPAAAPAGDQPWLDAAPDRSAAPYPLVLSSSKMGFTFGPHLASYGFVVMGINGQGPSEHWGKWLTDYPRDIVLALNQVAAAAPEGLEGVIDTERAGATGYSFDSFTSMALSGARIDPEFYQAKCGQASSTSLAPPEWWLDYICNMPGGWDEFVANAGPAVTTTTDGLWQPITDPRIRAVVPMAPEGAWLFGERGLAAVDRPVLIIAAGSDGVNIYDLEAAYIFDHLGTADATMISFLGQGHMMIDNQAQIERMRHFATAFFSVQLQQKEEFAKYLSPEFVGNYADLSWVPRKNP